VKGRRFQVEGRVQGVGFRYWARTVARELGIVGSVRNLPDGGVEIEAAAPEPVLSSFRERLRTGPPSAEVISLTEEECEVDASGFRIQG
jgi:acylphosphatase